MTISDQPGGATAAQVGRTLAIDPPSRALTGACDGNVGTDNRRHAFHCARIHLRAPLPDIRQAAYIADYQQVHLHLHDFDPHGIAPRLRPLSSQDRRTGCRADRLRLVNPGE